MEVKITDDEDVVICRVTVNKVQRGTYEYLIDTEDQGIESDGMIFNHTGDNLELLEKILHGRNVSS